MSGDGKAQECTATPVTVFFANGVQNERSQALIGVGELRSRLRAHVEGTAIQATCLKFDLAYNQNESFSLLGDLLEAGAQLLVGKFSRFWRFWANLDLAPDWFQEFAEEFVQRIDLFTYVLQADLQEHVVQYSMEIGNGREVVVVAHSQGNLYANQAYDRITDCCPNLIPKLHIVAVATPASFVAGDGPYTTLREDFFADVLFELVNPSRLNPNSENPPPPCGYPWRCHSFVDSYLAGSVSGPRILNQIVATIPPGPPVTLPVELGFRELSIGTTGTRTGSDPLPVGVFFEYSLCDFLITPLSPCFEAFPQGRLATIFRNIVIPPSTGTQVFDVYEVDAPVDFPIIANALTNGVPDVFNIVGGTVGLGSRRGALGIELEIPLPSDSSISFFRLTVTPFDITPAPDDPSFILVSEHTFKVSAFGIPPP